MMEGLTDSERGRLPGLDSVGRHEATDDDDDDDGDDDDEDDIFCSEVTLQSNSCVQLTLQRAEHRLVLL